MAGLYHTTPGTVAPVKLALKVWNLPVVGVFFENSTYFYFFTLPIRVKCGKTHAYFYYLLFGIVVRITYYLLLLS